MELFNIGFVPFRLIDVIDILVATAIMTQVLRLLRGSIAIRIIGVIAVVLILWKVTEVVGMTLLKTILDELFSTGTLAIIVLFSPEIRKFLLTLGRNTILDRLLRPGMRKGTDEMVRELVNGVKAVQKAHLGALIAVTRNDTLDEIKQTGDQIYARVTPRLIHSIFWKNSPLHDGAMIISDNRIEAAGCILPLTSSSNMPTNVGLRHRAAMGLAETTDALVIAVSEERAQISLAYEGQLFQNIDLITLEVNLIKLLRGEK